MDRRPVETHSIRGTGERGECGTRSEREDKTLPIEVPRPDTHPRPKPDWVPLGPTRSCITPPFFFSCTLLWECLGLVPHFRRRKVSGAILQVTKCSKVLTFKVRSSPTKGVRVSS